MCRVSSVSFAIALLLAMCPSYRCQVPTVAPTVSPGKEALPTLAPTVSPGKEAFPTLAPTVSPGKEVVPTYAPTSAPTQPVVSGEVALTGDFNTSLSATSYCPSVVAALATSCNIEESLVNANCTWEGARRLGSLGAKRRLAAATLTAEYEVLVPAGTQAADSSGELTTDSVSAAIVSIADGGADASAFRDSFVSSAQAVDSSVNVTDISAFLDTFAPTPAPTPASDAVDSANGVSRSTRHIESLMIAGLLAWLMKRQ